VEEGSGADPGCPAIDGIINAATVAENKPHYIFRVNDDAAWW
jgi:hypothetical protein